MQGIARSARAIGRFFRRHQEIVVASIAVIGGIALVVVASNAYILLSTRGESTDHVTAVKPAQTALVLGAQVKPDGDMSKMLADRVEQTARLWRSGKVRRILVSGDHSSWRYDEPDTMRVALQRDGVPARVIFEDHDGLDTWASMVRAKKVFNVRSAIIVTQGFHMPRALFLADQAGLDATGLISDLHAYGVRGKAVATREVFARVKAIGDAFLDSGVTLGPEIPISGPNGQVSWGPAPPPGTPPAGAPNAVHAGA